MSGSNRKGKERFTITDYVYDREEEHHSEYDRPHAESSRQALVTPSLSPPPRAQTSPYYQPERRGSLRLHEPTPHPQPHNDVYLPSPTHDLSLQPSIPYTYSSNGRSFESSRDMQQTFPGGLQSPPHSVTHGIAELPMSPRSHMTHDTERDADAQSVISSSDVSEKRDSQYKEKDWELKVVPSKPKTRWWDRLIPGTPLTKLLLATILIETSIDLIIEGNILYRFNQEVKSSSSTELELENERRLPIYLIIFGLAHLWQLVLTAIAIRTKNTVQVIAVTAFNFAFLGYAIIQIYELRTILGGNLSESLSGESDSSLLTIPLNVLTALIIGVVAASCLVLSVLCVLLRREFGWHRYRFLGADLMIREYYFKFQVFECICYFSAFFCAGFGIQFIWLVLNPTDVEYIITWVAFPLLIVFLVIGRFAAKYENTYFMAGFMLGLLAGCAYFIFKLVRIWQQVSTTYEHLEKSLTTFDAFSLVLLVACAIWGVMVWVNFGKGLKQAMSSRRTGLFAGVLRFWSNESRVSDEKAQEISMSQRRIIE